MYFYYKETAVENQERNDELLTAGNCMLLFTPQLILTQFYVMKA